MVGPINKKEEIRCALKLYILKDREKQRQEEEAEAEKTRKKQEEEEKKSKEQSEFKAMKDKLADLVKKQEQLQQDKLKLFEHLKKIISDPSKNTLQSDDLSKLLGMGFAVSHLTPPPSVNPPSHTTISTSAIPRVTTASASNQYKTPTTTAIPLQVLPAQKRNRSPSPTVYRPTYSYKQAAGPHAFQKLEDPHRNHEFNRSYLYKPGTAPPPSSSYSAFYPPGQTVAYTHPSATVHGNAAVYSYNTNRENIEVLHKNAQVAPPQPTPPQHSSLYPPHRSLPAGPSSMTPNNHVSYLVDPSKGAQPYPDDKYFLVRPSSHVPVHGGVIPIQQSSPVNKHGSITAGYPVRPVATQIAPQSQLHIQTSHGGHHPSHSSSQSSHSSQQPPVSQSHHPASHHQQHIQQLHVQSHHSQAGSHHQLISHTPHSLSQSSHSSQQPSVSQSHHPASHHQQHIQQLHVQSHHPQAGSHHQLISHPSSIHHTSSQHLQQAMHHQQQSQSHHPSHSQSLHHQPLAQSHIQQHISHQSHSQGQQSQPPSVVTSQAYANQISAIQASSRVGYNQPSIPH